MHLLFLRCFSSFPVLCSSRSWISDRLWVKARRRCSWCRCRPLPWRRRGRRSGPTANPTRRASKAEDPSSPGGDGGFYVCVQPDFSCLFFFFIGILGTNESSNWQETLSTHNSEGEHCLVDCYTVRTLKAAQNDLHVSKTVKEKLSAVVKPQCLTPSSRHRNYCSTVLHRPFLFRSSHNHWKVTLYPLLFPLALYFSTFFFIFFFYVHVSGVHNLEAESPRSSTEHVQKNTGTFHSHGDIILLFCSLFDFIWKSEDIVIFLMYSQVSTKLTLKRDNGLYNLYVMYLMKDAKTITVQYSIKEQNWVLFQKLFNWKFQLSDNEKNNNSCSCACSSVQRNRFRLHVFIRIACKGLSKWQKKTWNNQHYWLVSSIALQVIILY